MTDIAEDKTLRPIHLRMPAQHIVILKYILESYEGIAELRTLNTKDGEVVLLALEDTVSIVEDLLSSLQESLEITPVEISSSLKSDWLLSEITP